MTPAHPVVSTRWRARATCAAVLTAALPWHAAPAQPPTRTLPRAEVEFPEPFTTITDLRVLRDGRLIVTDAREGTVQLLDLASGRATPIGRQGAGPREWGRPGPLLPLPGDTTLMLDVINRRVLVLAPDGRPVRTEPAGDEDLLWQGTIGGVDASGRVLLVLERRSADPTGSSTGVADVVRFDRRTRRADTVGTLLRPKGERTAARMLGNGMMQLATNLPLAARDLAVLSPDGRVILVRAQPYRLEFVAPTGARQSGPVAEAPRVPVTRAEQEAFLRQQVRPGAIIIRGGPSGEAPTGGAPRPRAPAITADQFKAMMEPDMTWPRVLPPFRDDAARVAPDGRVWVLRTRAASDPVPVYDVFDGTGRVVERVALPPRTRLVGFGARALYLARTDADDLVWLQRVRQGA